MSRNFMFGTTNPSNAQTNGLRWPAIVGLILTPLLIAGVLAWGFGAFTERVSKVQAVVVNNDQMVEYNGNKVPLGRQFAAKLIAGDNQYDWQLDSATSARKKLAKGNIVAIVTIPKDFSKHAISYAKDPKHAVQSSISVTTSTKSSVLDKAVTRSLVTTARSAFNTEMTKSYLQNVFVSFGTLSENLEQAADGSDKLAAGAGKIQKGNSALAKGAYKLSDGLDALGTGTEKYVAGIDKLADGNASLAKGAKKLAKGTKSLTSGTQQLADGLDQTQTGSGKLAKGLKTLNSKTSELKSGAAELASGAKTLATLVESLAPLRQACAAGSQDACAKYEAIEAQLPKIAAGVSTGATELSAGISGTSKTTGLADGISELSAGATSLDSGLSKLSGGASSLAKGTKKLSKGTKSLASGASKLATGARTAADAGSQLVDGTNQTAAGASELGNGADKLASGGGKVASGIAKVGSGLHQASDSIPSYTKAQSKRLSKVVASPLKATASPLHGLFGSSVLPWVAALALWIGLLAVYVAVQAVPRSARLSTKSALALAARSYVPGAIIGAISGLLVGVLSALIAGVSLADGTTIVGLCVLAGLSFAAVNQGLSGLFGWAGRLVSLLMGVIIAVAVMVSTAPALLAQIAALTPLGSLIDGVQTQLTGSAGITTTIAGLIVWGVIGFLMSVFATVRARSTKSADAKAPEVAKTAV